MCVFYLILFYKVFVQYYVLLMVIMVVAFVTVKRVGKVPNVMFLSVNVKCLDVPVMDDVLKASAIVNVDGKDNFVINVSKILCYIHYTVDFLLLFFSFLK